MFQHFLENLRTKAATRLRLFSQLKTDTIAKTFDAHGAAAPRQILDTWNPRKLLDAWSANSAKTFGTHGATAPDIFNTWNARALRKLLTPIVCENF